MEKLSQSLEDYLEAIYKICLEKHVAHANQISEELEVSKSSVSWALKQLSDKGLMKRKIWKTQHKLEATV